MSVRVAGKVTPVRPLQRENAYSPMPVTPDGIAYAPLLPPGYRISTAAALSKSTPPTAVYAGFASSTAKLCRLLQLLNASEAMLVTLPGIVIPVSALQALNADVPMLVTLPGIVTPVSALQPLNA